MSYCYMMTQTVTLTFFMNCYSLIDTESAHFQRILANLNCLTDRTRVPSAKVFNGHLVDAIKLHISLKRYNIRQRPIFCHYNWNVLFNFYRSTLILSEIISGTLFFQLSCNVVYIAASLNLMEEVCCNIHSFSLLKVYFNL